MVFPEPVGWGGKRARAGRPAKLRGRPGVSHLAREKFDGSRHPVLVSVRTGPEVGSLRRDDLRAILFDALRASNARGWIAIIDFSILSNHLHFLIECADEKALSRGMQGFLIRLSKAINRALGRRRGTVFPDRYHSEVKRTPTEVRNAVLYVVNNFRKHLAESGLAMANDWIDPFSSGRWFDGWRAATALAEPAESRPVAEPRTWLRREGWRRAGPAFACYATPGRDADAA